MDPGLIKLLEDDEEDESGPPVSGAAVDAYTERLKGVLGDGATVAAAAAYGLARAGNGSLKPIPSPASLQAPTASSVPPATAGTPKAMSAPVQITQEQWNKLTPQQQQVYRQQHLYRQQLAQRQQQQAQQRAGAQQQQAQQQQVQQVQQTQQQQHQQQTQQQQTQQTQQTQQQQQQAGAAAGAQAQRRPNTISQGISFGALMPLLQPHLPPDKSERLSALYQRFKQNEITREDFVRGARVIVGDQVLVQTIRQMHQKQGPPQAGAQQAAGQQPAVSQQSATSAQVSASQQPGQQPVQQAAIPSGSSAQASEPQSSQAATTANVPSAVPVHTQPLHQHQQQQQQQGQSQAGSNSAGLQQSKVEVQPQGSSQSSQGKPPGLLPGAVPVRQNVPGNLKPTEQNVQGGEATSQTVSSAAPTLQQVKNEVEKAAVPAQAARPLQVPASSPFGGFQARPPTLSTPHAVGSNQVHLGVPAQVPRVSTPVQFNALPQAGQVRPAFSQALSDSSQQSDPKPVPVLTKYAKAKLRKEQKKAEEEERMRKLQEEDRLRRQQAGGATVGSSQPLTPTQVAQSLSMPAAVPQPHPKLLEGKNPEVVHATPAVKQEPQADQHAGQRGLVAPIQTSQVGIRAPGQVDVPETAGNQATPTAAKEVNVGSGGGDKSQMSTPQAANPMARYPGVPGVGNAAHPIAVGAAASGSSTPQPGGGIRQGPPYSLASSVAPGLKDALGSGSSGLVGSGAQAMSGGVKTPVKKAGVAVGQKKPGEAIPAAAQPANKKQKTQGPDADQSIDALNDVTAVSGVNLREEEEQLLAGPKEESRTTEAMRKFVQEEEERLFLEKGPLRAKVQAIAAKFGLSLSDDMERCLSLACEERLRSMLYKMIKYSKQRCDIEKDLHTTVTGFDPRRQILLMKRRTKEAMEKKLAAENERLRKLNEKKDKGALTDGDNEDLRLKAQKAQQEEDDKMRAKAANVAARAAVGATDMLSKWQMMAAQGLAKRQGGDTATESARAASADEASGSREQEGRHENGEAGKATGSGRTDSGGDGAPASAAASRPPGPGPGTGRGGNNAVRRIGAGHGGKQPRSMTMKDVIALLEREPVMSKSAFLYRLYERRDRKGESSRRL